MEALHFTLLLLCSLTLVHSISPNCYSTSQGSTLRVYHVSSPCSPFRPKTPLSWEESVLQMQADDKTRLSFLTSLVAGRSFVPVGSGRQIIQSPTYIVKANIGTPAQSLLMALDTSTDMALVPCAGCVGCSSATFDSTKSISYSSLACGADQCKQVRFNKFYTTNIIYKYVNSLFAYATNNKSISFMRHAFLIFFMDYHIWIFLVYLFLIYRGCQNCYFSDINGIASVDLFLRMLKLRMLVLS